jgi:thiol-disulfide isomerase/thioredoxin
MPAKFKVIFAAVIVALSAGFGYMLLRQSGEVPAITLKTIDGRQFDLTQLRGRPLLVNFWATTCVICLKEMPELIELYQELHPQGLELIAVAMAYDPPNRVVELAGLKQIPYPIALDLDSTAAEAFGEVQLTPTMFLISPEGYVAQQYIGAVNMSELRERIQQYL